MYVPFILLHVHLYVCKYVLHMYIMFIYINICGISWFRHGFVIAVTTIDNIGLGTLQPGRGFSLYPVKYKVQHGYSCTHPLTPGVQVHVYMYMLMRDAEGRKKQARSCKQTTMQSNTAHPRQSLFQRKMSCFRECTCTTGVTFLPGDSVSSVQR